MSALSGSPPWPAGTRRQCCCSAGPPAVRRVCERRAASLRPTGMPVFTETSPARLEHGAGLPGFPRLGFYPEQAAAQLKGASHVLLAGVHEPPTDTTLPSTR